MKKLIASNNTLEVTKMFKKQHYMTWEEYSERIDFIDNLLWSQSVRRQSLANI